MEPTGSGRVGSVVGSVALRFLCVFVQDEVLAVSRKMVLRVEDLVRWSCARPPGWSRSPKPAACGSNGLHKPPQSGDGGTGAKSSEPLKDKSQSKNRPQNLHSSPLSGSALTPSRPCVSRRAGGASRRQSSQLPAVLSLPLAAAPHPGWGEGPGSAGPTPAGAGRRQGAAQRPGHVLQGHLQPPDAGEQRRLLLAVQ